LIDNRQSETKEEIRRANNLLINVKDSHQILSNDLLSREEALVREV
jgi:hypothetical protein